MNQTELSALPESVRAYFEKIGDHELEATPKISSLLGLLAEAEKELDQLATTTQALNLEVDKLRNMSAAAKAEIEQLNAARPAAIANALRAGKGLDEDTKTVARIRALEHVIEATRLAEPVLMGQIKGAGRRAESAAESSERIAADLKACRDQLRLAEAQRRAF